MIAFYVENPAVVAALAWHFHMKGVLEITCKIMEIELD